LNYFGQGAALLRDPNTVSNPFYLMAPEWALVPLLIISTCAAVIASQAVISGLFSMASQCVQLGYSPRLKVIHTSTESQGQIYVPAVNWMALVGTIWLVIEFKTSSSLASAYGITISLAMVVTTILTAIVARHTWGWGWARLGIIFSMFAVVDAVFLGANLLKIADGGWIPLMIAAGFFTLMTTWKKGRAVLSERLRAQSHPFPTLLEELKENPPARVPGSAVFMVGDANVTPPTLIHNIKHNKVLHETVVFLTFIGEDVAFVADKDRAQISEIAPGFYRVTAHFGFSETPEVIPILKRCEGLLPGFQAEDPTFFLGREILVAGGGEGLALWRKVLFGFMTRNAESANIYFKIPLDRVIEVGMQIKL
jgi:KUP system potassium uptake protein